MILMKDSDMHISWFKELKTEFKKPYMKDLRSFLAKEKLNNRIVCPESSKIFYSLMLTPLESTKVVIIGQDPYHGEGQAQGLAFSVESDRAIPPSLVNIFKEIKSDMNIEPPIHGDLSNWSRQGVLLLNSVLTVEKGNPASHAGRGWEGFTDKIIEILNKRDGLVFLLWGAHAQKKGLTIDRRRHLVLEASHPSPLSAHRGFFGCKHFSKTNKFLRERRDLEIQWS
jgi:uracil-DNA glycosylase